MAAFGVVLFALLLLFAIFFHELGHYLTAKWAGIKVRAFFVGFGPTLWSFRRGRGEVVEDPKTGELVERPETEYGVKLLPLGGFVKVVGMSPFEDVAPEDRPRSFDAAPSWKRAIVLGAGSITHFVTAFVVLLLMFSVVGLPDPDKPTLTVDVIEREINGAASPALAAGLEPGDEILAVDGRRLESWETFRQTIRANPGETLRLTVRTSTGEVERRSITPAVVRQGQDAPFGIIGVGPAYGTTRVGPVAAVGRSVEQIGAMLGGFAQAAPEAFAPRNLGLVPGEEPSDTQRAISVVGAGRIAGELAARGQIARFMFMFAMLNLFIGLFNLLPMPPLDGGHLLLLGIEKVRGKPADPKVVLPVMAVGTSLLLIMAAALLFQDIVNPVDFFDAPPPTPTPSP